MEIHYLSDLKSVATTKGEKAEGLSGEEIHLLEEQYNSGKKLPKVYREYLSIVGKYSFLNLFFIEHGEMQEEARKALEKYGQKLPYPFWVVMQKDDFEQFGFFFTNSGEDDPIFYNCFPAYVEDGFPLYREHPVGPFSKFIGLLVEEIKNRKI